MKSVFLNHMINNVNNIKNFKFSIPKRFIDDINQSYFVDAFETINKLNMVDYLKISIDIPSRNFKQFIDWMDENFMDYLNNEIDIPLEYKNLYKTQCSIYRDYCYMWFTQNTHITEHEIKTELVNKFGNVINDVNISNYLSTDITIYLDFKNFDFNIFNDNMLKFIELKHSKNISIDSKWLSDEWSELYVEQGLSEYSNGKSNRKYCKEYYKYKRDIVSYAIEKIPIAKYMGFDFKLVNMPNGDGLLYLLRKQKLDKIFN